MTDTVALQATNVVKATVANHHAVIAPIANIVKVGLVNHAFAKLPTMLNYRRVHM